MTTLPWALGLAVTVASLGGSRPAMADGLDTYKGKVVVSAQAFGSFGSNDDLAKALKSQGTATLKETANEWPLYFIALLSKAAGDASVHLVLYDVTGGKQRNYVNVYDFTIKPDATIVSGESDLTEDDGFSSGHVYEVDITRMIDDKETIYAQGQISLTGE
jgi:hypothetical protein